MKAIITEIAHLRAALDVERMKVKWLRAALQAAQVQWDRGPCPEKLDDPMTWGESDEMIADMVRWVIAETEDAK
ncbi:MAG: hypothetical protein BWY96_03081 [Spirochaetes bacterium ADurb.BinA120]|nr:MAG: hypothetical protein BWY96_03081 [Spirochaetes bacterium ADurb.BinA120]